jgi:hypothetical protein
MSTTTFDIIIDSILSKLNTENSLTVLEKKQILTLYLSVCKHEYNIFKLIYDIHGCNAYGDIFNEYDPYYFESKIDGIEIAISELEKIK